MKAFQERAIKGEMNHFLQEEKQKPATSNSRNGYTNHGTVRVTCPRDRQGRFIPRIIPKHSRRFEGFDDQIVALYARGMSTRDIQNFLYEQYGTEVSATLISEVTDEVMLSVTEWQLDPMYPVVFFDTIRIKIRNAGDVVVPKAMHIALGTRADGTKDILGLWLDDTVDKSRKFERQFSETRTGISRNRTL